MTTAICGATGTIGSGLARRLVDVGESVLLVGRNEEKLSALGAEIDQPWAVVDFSQSQSLVEVLESHAAERPLTGIVNAIGSLILKPAHATSDEEFRATLEANLFTSFAVVRAAGRLLRQSGGSVVLFASAAAQIGVPNHEAIAAAKAGVIGLMRSAAATYAAQRIRFNVVSPGLTRTELTRRIWQNELSAAASQEMHALGRLGEPNDVVLAAEWLLSAASSWVTGQALGVDGGLSTLIATRRTAAKS
jgi:NAD(P)-dependent dehydrogenase (short-subunit alcohol dehydrogenase family)